MTTAKRPPGRPEVSEADRLKVGTIRLTQAQWAKLAALGGAAWLRKKIDAAKAPLALGDSHE
jgi:hypothetical protein